MRMNRVLQVFISIILLFCSYFIFSANGMFPKAISLDLPGWLQNYNTHLTQTGFTVSDKVEYESKHTVIKKGAFDKLDLFSNGNAAFDYAYDADRDVISLVVKDGKEMYINRFNVKKWDQKKSIKNNDLMNGMPIKLGHRYYICDRDGDVQVLFSKNMISDIHIPDMSYEEMALLLEKQHEEKITLTEFAALLSAYKSGTLLGWYPEEHTAIFTNYVSNQVYGQIILTLSVYNTQTLECTYSQPLVNEQFVRCISANEVVCYNREDAVIKRVNIFTGESVDIITEISSVKKFNFQKMSDESLYIAYLTQDNLIYFTDIYKANGLTKCIPDTQGNVTDSKTVILFMNDNIYYFTDDCTEHWGLR